jgi:hypothetical protein
MRLPAVRFRGLGLMKHRYRAECGGQHIEQRIDRFVLLPKALDSIDRGNHSRVVPTVIEMANPGVAPPRDMPRKIHRHLPAERRLSSVALQASRPRNSHTVASICSSEICQIRPVHPGFGLEWIIPPSRVLAYRDLCGTTATAFSNSRNCPSWQPSLRTRANKV